MQSVPVKANYSHPDQPVRHSYPLAAEAEGLVAALNLCLKTMPFMLLRLGVLLGSLLVALVWFALCAGIAMLFSGKDGSGGGGGFILFLFGVVLPAGVFMWVRRYVLYILKLGHIAVLTELITEGRLPEKVSQIEYGKSIIKQHFTQGNVFFALDSMVKGVTSAFNSTLDWLSNLIPIPGLETVMAVVHKIVKNATTYVDETIFSYTLARRDENVFRSSADGLVYYAQNAKPILTTAVWGLVYDYVISFVLFLICLAPAAAIAYLLPGNVTSFSWIIAIVVALSLRSAVVRPVFLAMVALTFHKHAYGQAINADMSGHLSKISSKFCELVEKGKTWVTGKGASTATETSEAA